MGGPTSRLPALRSPQRHGMQGTQGPGRHRGPICSVPGCPDGGCRRGTCPQSTARLGLVFGGRSLCPGLTFSSSERLLLGVWPWQPRRSAPASGPSASSVGASAHLLQHEPGSRASAPGQTFRGLCRQLPSPGSLPASSSPRRGGPRQARPPLHRGNPLPCSSARVWHTVSGKDRDYIVQTWQVAGLCANSAAVGTCAEGGWAEGHPESQPSPQPRARAWGRPAHRPGLSCPETCRSFPRASAPRAASWVEPERRAQAGGRAQRSRGPRRTHGVLCSPMLFPGPCTHRSQPHPGPTQSAPAAGTQ